MRISSLRTRILFRQGLPADCLYFVKSGEANLMMQAGGNVVWIRAGQGLLLGIPAIVGNQAYSMTAKVHNAYVFDHHLKKTRMTCPVHLPAMFY